MITTRTTVTVDAADLERLIRIAHQLNRDVAECTCGQSVEPHLRVPLRRRDAEVRARHAEHVAYHVRQALAGRIEFA